MNKKEKRIVLRQNVEKAVVRDEQNRRIQDAATNSAQNVLRQMNAALRGLDAETVLEHRNQYGSNKVTHEKKKSLVQRLAGAFVNPFTAILFCLALVSTMTDMVFPYFSLLGAAGTRIKRTLRRLKPQKRRVPSWRSITCSPMLRS